MREISKNRGFLMGVAIILIMFCHNTIEWNHIGAAWTNLSSTAQCGVDIFLLLSGFGLYFSYSKEEKYVPFLKRRFIRIIPKYLCVVIPFGIICCLAGIVTVHEAIWNYSLISFFVEGNLSEWFIAAICALYVVYPLVYKIVRKDFLWIPVCIFIWAFAILLSFCAIPKGVRIINEIFIVRIPTFIVGSKMGQKTCGGG